MKKLFKITLIVVAILFSLFVVTAGYFYWLVYHPQTKAQREQGLPEIARNLPDDWTLPEFNRRVQENYPLGMKEADLISQLSKAGFEIDLKNEIAEIHRGGLPCEYLWRIFWDVDGSAIITKIGGLYGTVCL